MATNYIQDGRTLEYQNISTEDIVSGQAVAVGSIIGIAHDDIPAGLWGVLHTTGVFSLPKVTAGIDRGQKVYLNADGLVTDEADNGDEHPVAHALAGTAWNDAEADDESVAVRLG